MRRVFALATLLTASTASSWTAVAQTNKGPSEEDRARTYLADKQRVQQQFRTGLAGLGRGQDAADMARSVRAHSPTQSRKLRHSASTEASLDAAFYDDIALELATLGFNNGDLQSARGASLIRAAIAKRTAAATYSDLALLSDTVGFGTVVSSDVQSAQDDGLGGRVVITPDELLKGNLRGAKTLTIVLFSGTRDQAGRPLIDAHEYVPAAGTRVAFLASQASYDANRAAKGRGGPKSTPTAMKLVNLLTVSGDRVISNDDFLPSTTVTEFRAVGGQK